VIVLKSSIRLLMDISITPVTHCPVSRSVHLSNTIQYFRFVLCEHPFSTNHRFWFRYRIGYILIPLILLILYSLPYIILPIVDLYVLHNQLPLFAKHEFPWQLFTAIPFFILDVYSLMIPPPLYYTDQIVLSLESKIRLKMSKLMITVKIIMIILSAFMPVLPFMTNYNLSTKIGITCTIYIGLYGMVGLYYYFKYILVCFDIKSYLLEEVNSKRNGCFRYRIGYLIIIPLIFFACFSLQYTLTIVFTIIYPLDYLSIVSDSIVGVIITIADLGITIW
jgi:hypothetical protein